MSIFDFFFKPSTITSETIITPSVCPYTGQPIQESHPLPKSDALVDEANKRFIFDALTSVLTYLQSAKKQFLMLEGLYSRIRPNSVAELEEIKQHLAIILQSLDTIILNANQLKDRGKQ